MSPFEKGILARKIGKQRSDNPYHHGTSIQSKNNREWARGYDAALPPKPEEPPQ